MKKPSIILLLASGLISPAFGAYSVYDSRANALLNQIKNINQEHLETTGELLNVNQSELEVLKAIYEVLGEPEESSRILTGESRASGGSGGGISDLTNTIQGVTDGLSSGVGNNLSNSIQGITGGLAVPNISIGAFDGLDGALRDVESFMGQMPGYEDFDIGEVFKGLGHINTFLDGDFARFRETIGDPSGVIADTIMAEIAGQIDNNGLLSDVEGLIGQRILDFSADSFNSRRGSLLGDISKLFMARALDNVTESAQRNEVLSKETQKAYEEAASATTFTQQMAAQNRIQSGNNMIQLERNRVINETSAAEITIQGRELDILEFQERDRFLDNALK